LIKIAKLAIEKIEELTGSKKQEILSQVLSKRTNQVIVLLFKSRQTTAKLKLKHFKLSLEFIVSVEK
jgi:hypothetical protein